MLSDSAHAPILPPPPPLPLCIIGVYSQLGLLSGIVPLLHQGALIIHCKLDSKQSPTGVVPSLPLGGSFRCGTNNRHLPIVKFLSVSDELARGVKDPLLVLLYCEKVRESGCVYVVCVKEKEREWLCVCWRESIMCMCVRERSVSERVVCVRERESIVCVCVQCLRELCEKERALYVCVCVCERKKEL